MNDNVSVVIPAFNEEGNIEETIKLVVKLTSSCLRDYEVIVVNDGSTDNTGEIVENLARKNSRIKIITHYKNQGLGTTYLDGIKNSSKTFVTGFPADNDQSAEILTDLIRFRKKADLVLGYMTNLNTRELKRKIISQLFIKLMNLIFRLNLKYYNGYFICKVDLLKKITLKSPGFTLFAEAKIRLIKKGMKFIEVPYETKPRVHGDSKALNWKNIFQTVYIILILINDIYFKSNEKLI